MRSILRLAALAAATFSLSAIAQGGSVPATSDGQETGSADDDGLALNAITEVGCFSNPGKMIDMGYYTFQTAGWCQPLCVRLSHTFFALTNGTTCLCGDAPPSSKYQVDSSFCKTPCKGDDQVTCGGTNYFDVQNANWSPGEPTGSQTIIIPTQTWVFYGPGATGAGAAATSSSTTQTPTVAATVTVSAAANSNTSTPSASVSSTTSGPNTAAIAAGVVVGIVVLTAIIAGVFFYMRRQKQRAQAEEQRRHEMMTNFVTAEKPGSTYTSPDSRLDPSLMFSRRLSDGSIRDNQDYSRRILKVANPDA